MISVITVVRNAEATIERTLKSVFAQKQVSFELVVWDGMSNDNTLNILENYKSQITLVSDRDSGVYDAMNRALKLSRGKWVIFLNADDYFFSEYSLYSLWKKAEESACDYVCGSAKMLFGLKKWSPKTLTDVDFFLGNPSNHQSYLCKKQVYDQLGDFNLDFRYASDVDFMFRAIKSNVIGCSVPETIAVYSLGGLSTKNISEGVAELDRIRAKFLKVDLKLATQMRLVFNEGFPFTQEFKSKVLTLPWSLTQKEFLEKFFSKNKAIEEMDVFAILNKKLILFLKIYLRKFLFFIISKIPSRYI
ncbi:MAG: glycosyltransferase family 2 protein [Leptospira sp.]|nr:glycosyltransferase family 2 protein [Leptospira sp.]